MDRSVKTEHREEAGAVENGVAGGDVDMDTKQVDPTVNGMGNVDSELANGKGELSTGSHPSSQSLI